MKTVKSVLLFFYVLLLTFSSIHSQNVVPNSEFMLDKLRLNKIMHGIEYETYTTTTGDPFIYRDFHEGELTLRNGETYWLEMRYDIYANQMHLRNNNEIYAINYPEKLASISIDMLQFLFCNYANSPGKENSGEGSYFIVKTDGKCKLLIRKNIRVQDAEPPKVLQETKPAKFVHLADTYYLKFDGNSAVKTGSKKDLIRQFGDKQNEVNSFIDENNMNVKNVEDLIRIVSFYNNLQ